MKTSRENDWAEEKAAAIVDVIKNNVGEPGFKWFDQEQAIAASLREARDNALEEAAKAAEDYDYMNETRSGVWAADAIRSLRSLRSPSKADGGGEGEGACQS